MRRSLCTLATVLVSAVLYNAACSSDSNEPGGDVGASGGGATQDGSADRVEGGGTSGQSGQAGQAGQAGKGGQGGTGVGGTDGGVAGQGGKSGEGGSAGGGGTGGGGGIGGAGAGGEGGGGVDGSGGKDGGVAGGAVDGGPSNCTTISATGFTGSALGARVTGSVTPNLGQPDPDVLYIQLYEQGSFVQTPGTFDLSMESGYNTCNHCVFVYQDSPEGIFANKYFFQASGTMEVIEVTSPPKGQSKGTLSQVKLIEVQMDMITPVPDGQCLLIESVSWDTVPVPVEAGTPCHLAAECGDFTQNVCDPKTSTCQPYGCDVYGGGLSCSSSELCVEQVENVGVGACYIKCLPFNSPTCDPGFQCVPVDDSLLEGVCKAIGNGPANGACDPLETAVGSGCVDKFLCHPEAASRVCREACDFFNDNSTCTDSNLYCTQGGFCAPVAADTADIGASCTQGAGTPCGLIGRSYRGKCTAVGGTAAPTCAKLCRSDIDGDCSDNTYCSTDWYGDPVGVCL